jgi:hypothetical protein
VARRQDPLQQTLLGASWAVLQPFAMMVVFNLLFGKIGSIDSEGVPYPVFSYAGMVPWTFFEYAMPLASNSLISNSKLISKVYFPRAIIPAASALSGAVDFFIAIILVFIMFYHVPPAASSARFPDSPRGLHDRAGHVFLVAQREVPRHQVHIPFLEDSPFLSPVSLRPAMPESTRFPLNLLVGIIDSFAPPRCRREIDWGCSGWQCVVPVCSPSRPYFYKTERRRRHHPSKEHAAKPSHRTSQTHVDDAHETMLHEALLHVHYGAGRGGRPSLF